MRRVAYSKYVLPTAGKPGRTHTSNWLMNAQEAAAVGALCPVGPVEYREVPDTPEEERAALYSHPSAGQGGVLPPAGGRS